MDYDGYVREGDFVLCRKKRIKLIKVIAKGGEGFIYETDTPCVCKIYKREHLDNYKFEKLRLMVNMNINEAGICWPLEIVFNEYYQFMGYMMIRASGITLQKAVFNRKYQLDLFPQWTKLDLVKLSMTILEKIMYIHNRNIILGDINTKNILVVSPKEVYFVDTDSYQIAGIPCPVGTKLFTPPEIQGRTYNAFLRTYGNEYFSIATLIFMILLMGATPYQYKNKIDLGKNIKAMKFKLPLKNYWENPVAKSRTEYIWSHLPYFTREAFYTTFQRGQAHSLEYNRYSTEDWYYILKNYLYMLNSGEVQREDPMSIELLPTRFKKTSKFMIKNVKSKNNN